MTERVPGHLHKLRCFPAEIQLPEDESRRQVRYVVHVAIFPSKAHYLCVTFVDSAVKAATLRYG
jgi:hypothetical protein